MTEPDASLPDSSLPDASFIVPTRNRSAILALCLARLSDQTVPADRYEIVVVDDASEDDTPRLLAAFGAANLRHARNDTRRAAGLTRNRAIAMARGRMLVFVDDDALVRPDFLEEHLKSHEGRAGAIVAGPIIECTEPPAERAPAVGRRLGWHTNPFPTGNASVLRRHLLEAGGFDDDFRAYGWEDTEMYRRLKLLGLERVYNWRAPIWHCKPPGLQRSFFDRLRLEEDRGAMGAIYYAKHRVFNVALETKRLGLLDGLDRVLNAVLDLDGRIAAARASGVEPSSALMRLLMVNHAEIAAGRREWEALGPARREAMRRQAQAKVRRDPA